MIKKFARLALILAAFASAACVGLSFVYTATEAQIKENQGKQLAESLKDLFPTADDFREVTSELQPLTNGATLSNGYVATSAGAVVGVAVRASGPSYSGPVAILTGLGPDRRIAGVRVLASTDTPGLGLNAMNPTYYVNRAKKITFPGQFTGKPTGDAFVVKQDVDAISASTITSRAITGVVKASADSGQAWLDKAAMPASGGNQ